MKRVIAFVCAFICLAMLSSCDAPGVYSLNGSLPPLIDSETQYPYVQSVDITNSDGNTVTLVSSGEMDNIRMKFEGIKCVKEKSSEQSETLYTVTFNTNDGEYTISVISEDKLIIDGVAYDVLRGGADLFYLASLFN